MPVTVEDVRRLALTLPRMTELITDAWTMVVPKYVAREYFDDRP